MSILELKEQLISKIQITNEDYILEGLLRLWEFESKNAEVYQFNDTQRQRIKESQEQYARGEFYTEEEADKITDQWLNG
ncbi:MAG: hypothetical protein IPN26_11740 [Bacteroidetes bacterium]|nr:hypothetical protein [Bacteroidota bacterium]